MSGLLAYGAYLPRHRLQRAEIADALGTAAGKGARTVASFDEDSTTMGVEASRRALDGEVSADIYFATTAPAYTDKTNASAIHAALDFPRDSFAVDMAGSARSGFGALKAAAASGGLAILADVRTGRPGSTDERDSGDGAAAFLFGDGDLIAEIIGTASETAEFLDRWRTPGESASGIWEERFGMEMYMPLITAAAKRALDQAGVEQADRVIISSSQARAAAAAAKQFPGKLATTPMTAGYAGAADAGLKLANTLDQSGPGETILLISAADGADAIVLRTTAQIVSAVPQTAYTVAGQLSLGRDIRYATFLSWRGMLERETPRRPDPDRPAGPPSARTEAWKFGFVGSRCTNCGRIQLPPTRVCAECHAVDQMERARLSKVDGTVATFTVDRLAYSPSPPMIDVVVDFDGGGRYTLEMADAQADEVAIGTRVETTFRRLYTSGGVHNYFWKVRPASHAE
jgi:hydroxymethylglutaryl-CoA synthase